MTHQAMVHEAFNLARTGLGWEDVKASFPLLTDKTCWDIVKAAEARRTQAHGLE